MSDKPWTTIRWIPFRLAESMLLGPQALNDDPAVAIVVRDTPRTDLAVVDGLAELGVATVQAQDRIGLPASRLRPIYRPAAIAGNALTCEVAPGDSWMLHVAAEQAQPGDITSSRALATTLAENYAGLPCDAGWSYA
ncbi:MAG: 4-hydroxy-4-methyl-2-oxoglutarate aldolase [Frankiales bacterium]|nr:4-hydroxy-4-methyl-2-oxoglutarate aldolase [Frankiales bacterium]